jgi:hypothetical protein
MKYLKLFENFNNNIEDDLEDIKWILVELDDNPKLLRNELDGKLLIYEIDSNYNKEDLDTAIARLADIGYEILVNTFFGFSIIKSDYFKDKSIKGVALQWLNEKFGNLKKVDDNLTINYVDDNGETIIRFYKQRDKDDNYLINKDLVWSIFNQGFVLNYNNTQEIISVWLEETYNLTEMAPFAWVPKPNRN